MIVDLDDNQQSVDGVLGAKKCFLNLERRVISVRKLLQLVLDYVHPVKLFAAVPRCLLGPYQC